MLRRFTFSTAEGVPECPGWKYGHDAHAIIGEVPEADREAAHGDNWPHDDPAWPPACERCGYQFAESDRWQRNDNRIVALPDGTEFAMHGSFGLCAPPGAMVRASWYDDFAQKEFQPGELEESWLISLPDGGEWITTQKATDGGHWIVTGTPPVITASPSIFHNAPSGWHGFVRDGELVDA
jgi:hypothetical protein